MSHPITPPSLTSICPWCGTQIATAARKKRADLEPAIADVSVGTAAQVSRSSKPDPNRAEQLLGPDSSINPDGKWF